MLEVERGFLKGSKHLPLCKGRMALWRTICFESSIEEVLCLSVSMSMSSLSFFSASRFNLHVYFLMTLTGIPLSIKLACVPCNMSKDFYGQI